MTDKFTNSVISLLRPKLSGWYKGTIAEQRRRMDGATRLFPLAKQVKTRVLPVDGVPAAWFEGPDCAQGVILYLHGGAYALGSIDSHRELLGRLALSTRCKVLALNYRLAPEHPYPAALEDSLTAYLWLLAQGHDPARVFLAGDSAGGGLAIATLLALREKEMPLPAGALCFSPWLDLTLSGDSAVSKAALDPVLKADVLLEYAAIYAGSRPTNDPLISPLFADLRGLPPVYIQVGSREILLDDAARFCGKAQDAGVDARLDVWQGTFHVFQLIPLLPQSREALKAVELFIQRVSTRESNL